MKKIFIIIIFLLSLTFQSIYAYEVTQDDKNMIYTITQKMESIIEKKGESSRGKFVKELSKLSVKYKKNERLQAIIDEVVISLNKNNSLGIIESGSENINTFSTQINQLLKNGSTMKEIENPNFILPTDIKPEQIEKYFSLDTIVFALVLQGSSNVWLSINTYNTDHFVGVLVANKSDKKWTKLLKITDIQNSTKKDSEEQIHLNNPYYLLVENKKLLLTIVDDDGYSSEGNMKVFTLSKNDWKLEKCYYYTPDDWDADKEDKFKYSTHFSKHKSQPITSCNNVQVLSIE